MTMQGEMLGERTRARPPMRSAETEAAAISIATARIPTGRDVAWVSACLESAEERGIKFVIAARSRREAGGGLRNSFVCACRRCLFI